ncbi:MAG: glutamate--tRNA ligase family protein [Candidatus Shikimatogenerans sp. Tcar]|uniref:Glutamate--tRNA ligase family protein n=1 Tax=Candidatus Shikimatogenerans sp. Tcar TaxID=3158565 RepID=A0AAU7QTP4_9FLAO
MNFKKIILRFAPSPTGPLHIGNIRILLYNYILYKKYNGFFILRIDDTNYKKTKIKYVKYIFKTLKWLLNLKIKKNNNFLKFKQSKRLKIYNKYIQIMLKKNYAYYAYDSKKDIKYIKNKYKINNKNFEYNYKTRLFMNNKFNLYNFKKKKKYVIRYNNIPNKIINFKDLIYGNIKINTKFLNDVILFKSNGYPTYHFASVIDDYKFNITHVIRGKEWLSTTILHILIYKSFNWKLPKFLHISSILNPLNKKKKISKSNIITNIPILPIKYNKILGYKELGIFKLSIINYIFNNNNNILSFKKIINNFNINYIKKNNIIYNYNKILFYNKLIIKNLSLNKLLKIFIYLLNKYKIFFYKKIIIKKILFLIKNRLYTYKDLLYESIFFFKRPNIFNFKKNKIYKYILYNILFLIKKNKINNIFLLKNKNYNKILRLLITGKFTGIKLLFIINFFSKKELIKRLLYLKKFL